MDNKLSKIILAVTIGSMALITVSLGILNKEEYELKDIHGNRNELENVIVAYQERKGLYKTTQVNISKDNIEVDNYSKEMPSNLDLSTFNKKNRQILETSYYEDNAYKDDKSIIHAEVNRDYNYYKIDTKKVKYEAYIKVKDLETNKTTEKTISLDSNFEYPENTDVRNYIVPMKYNGQIYLAMASTMESMATDEVEDDSKKGCFIEIYKLDIENETSQIIFSEKISKPSEDSILNGLFINKNSFYFIKEEVEKNKIDTKKELLEYNLETKNLTSMEIPTDELFQDDLEGVAHDNRYSSSADVRASFRYEIEDNKINFVKYMYNMSKKEMYVYITTIDLENKKIISNNEKYTIKIDYPNFKYKIKDLENYQLIEFRNINDKVYIVLQAYSNESIAGNSTRNTSYLYVIDEKTKETVYVGELSKEKGYYSNMSMLKEDEL